MNPVPLKHTEAQHIAIKHTDATPDQPTPIEQISLYLCEGRSDKEYHLELLAVGEGYCVNFSYGRRGGTLTHGSKTPSPCSWKEAKHCYDQLLKQKRAKGYAPDVSAPNVADEPTTTPAYQSMTNIAKPTGFIPQLLNTVSEAEALHLLSDTRWAAQAKLDGERRAVQVRDGHITGINRRGLSVLLPPGITDELRIISAGGDLLVDGELIGDILHVFDLHIHDNTDLRQRPWQDRMQLARFVFALCDHIRPVPMALTATDKHQLWQQVQSTHGEGVVFKLRESKAQSGRPNSGGDWIKYKFTASASCRVLALHHSKRSVQVGVYAGDTPHSEAAIAIGNVTIPVNHLMPAVGDIVEVEYLYAYRGGSLFQPVYHGKRTDLDKADCTLAQLKYKPEPDSSRNPPLHRSASDNRLHRT